VEAGRFPSDFDGIIAGAAANPKTHLDAWRIWMAQAMFKDQASVIPPSKFPMIHQAVVGACDALDGLKDGLIDDPTKCHFDPNTLASTTAPATDARWVRLFMVPGMGHCSGGEGPNTFDMVAALDPWVESGKAPARIIASHKLGEKIDRTRPLCPYPQVARFTG